MDKQNVIVWCWLALLCLVGPGTSWSAENLDGVYRMSLEDLLDLEVSVASSKTRNVFESISTVSVIDRESIERYNFGSIGEAVRVLAGVDVSRTYLKRSMPTVRGILQTHYANKVLVMIDNVPTWHAVTGEANLERVHIKDVERIEVLKGPASVKYGTNSYSGAINVVLKKAKERESALQTTVGSFKTFELGVRHSAGETKSGTAHSVYANLRRSDGYDYRFTDEDGVTDSVKDFIGNRNLTWRMTSKHHDVLFNLYDGEEGYLGVVPQFDRGAGRDHELGGRLFHYGYKRDLDEKRTFSFRLGYDWNERDLARSDVERSDIAGYRTIMGTALQWQPRQHTDWEFGLDWEQRHSQSYRNYLPATGDTVDDNNLQDKDVWEYSLHQNVQWKQGIFNAAAGLRWTKNERFGNNTATNFTLVRPLGEQRSWKFIFAQSYRAPSLFELNFDTSSRTVFGNLDLEPEEATSFELAHLWKNRNLFGQATLYRASYENKILRALSNGTGPAGSSLSNEPQYVNGGDFDATGLELELRYENPRRGGLQGFLNLGIIDGDDGDRRVDGVDSDVYNFLSVPRTVASLGIQKGLGKRGSVSTVFRYVGSTRDTEGVAVDSVKTVDLNFRIDTKSRRGHFDLSVKNVFEEEVLIPEYARPTSDLSSVPGLGNERQVTVSYSVRF